MPVRLLVMVGGSYIYGAEKVTLDVLEGLSKKGYQIASIISGWSDGKFAERLEAIGIPYHKLKLGWYYRSKVFWSVDSLLNYPSALIKFLSIRRRFSGFVVYTTSFRQIILLWPFIDQQIVYHVHDPSSHSRQSRFFMRIVNKKVSRFIAVSNYIKSDLVACGIDASKIEVIHNGIDLKKRIEQQMACDTRLRFGIVGQIIERKGHADAIKALQLLIERGLDVELVIVGSGEEMFVAKMKEKIEALNLSSYVSWRKFQNNVFSIYEGIDVVIAPSRTDEPFALVALEASMMYRPIIVSDTGGFRESVIDGQNGFVIPTCNPRKLAEKIEFFYRQPSLVEAFGHKGRELVEAQFCKEMMIDKIDKLFQNI